jgi:hypothetical protein
MSSKLCPVGKDRPQSCPAGAKINVGAKIADGSLDHRPMRPCECFYLRFFEEVTLPPAALRGCCVLRSASMNMKWFGGAAQVNGVPCVALLTVLILSSNRVPDPDNGAKSFE